MPRRRAGAGASLALRRGACVGVGRRGSAGLLRARAAFDVRIHMLLTYTQPPKPPRAASAIEPPMQSRVDVAPTAFARDHRAAGRSAPD